MGTWWQPLVGVFAGWLLAQGTEIVRQKSRARKTKRGISAELRDIHSSVKVIISDTEAFMKTLQTDKGIDLPAQPIINQIFKTHFSTTSLEFGERERLLIVRIHDTVDIINAIFSTIRLGDVYLGTTESIAHNWRKILLALSVTYIDACKIDVLIDMFAGTDDLRNAQSIERLNRVASDAASKVRSLRGLP
jgi:hypothetical protein